MNIYSQAVKTAKEKMLSTNGDPDYMSGGFDIMKKLVKKLRKQQKKSQVQDFTVMQKLVKKPTPIKKNKSFMQPIEYAPDEPIIR